METMRRRLGLSILIYVALQMSVVSVNGHDCYSIFKQYYECKNLIMVDNLNDYYMPDPTIPGNSLNDSFFQSLNLQSKTLSQTLTMVRKMYDEAAKTGTKCKQLCKCLKSFLRGSFQVVFRNAKYQAGFTTILKDYINAYQAYMYSEATILADYYQRNRLNFTTLAKFCIKNEFGNTRLLFYNGTNMQSIYNCYTSPSDLQRFEWRYDFIFKSGIVQNNSRSVYEAELFNYILELKNCSKPFRRYEAIYLWENYAPKLTFPSGKTLITYLDSLFSKAKTGKPKIRFVQASFSPENFAQYTLQKLNQQIVDYDIIFNYTNLITNYTDTCFQTTNLRIDCTWFFSSSASSNGESFYLSKLNYTFKFPNNPPAKRKFTYLVDIGSMNRDFDEYVNGPTNKKLLLVKGQLKYPDLGIYEFSSKTYAYIWLSGIRMYVPTKLVNSAGGLLATGTFANAPWIQPA